MNELISARPEQRTVNLKVVILHLKKVPEQPIIQDTNKQHEDYGYMDIIATATVLLTTPATSSPTKTNISIN